MESKLALPDLAISGAAFPTTPVQMAYQSALPPGLALGMAVDPITGTTGQALITGITPPPSPFTAGNQTLNQTSFSMAANQQQYSAQVSADASATGRVEVVNGSFSANFFESLSVSQNSISMAAAGISLNGSWTPGATATATTWDYTAVTADQVVSEINSLGGYTAFINQYGSHFIGGVIYGNQYNASLTVSFSNASYQQQAQAQLSASFNAVVNSGQFSASLAAEASSQSGFSGTSWTQSVVGGYTPAVPATQDNINTNLGAFSQATPAPVLYLLYDWRIIPAVQTAAQSSTPSFNFQDYLNNLGAVQTSAAQLQYVVSTCQTMLAHTNYIGATNQQYVNTALANAQSALHTIQQYTPADVATFDPSTFAPQIATLGQLAQISNGLMYVQVTVTGANVMDHTKPATYGPQVFSVAPGTSGTRLGFFEMLDLSFVKTVWFWGFWVPGGQPPAIQAQMGVLDRSTGKGAAYTTLTAIANTGGPFSWSSTNSSANTQTISGFSSLSGYNGMTTTVQFV